MQLAVQGDKILDLGNSQSRTEILNIGFRIAMAMIISERVLTVTF